MPRRKYGRMVKPMPAAPDPRKCRFCKAGRPCPVHGRRPLPRSSKHKRDI